MAASSMTDATADPAAETTEDTPGVLEHDEVPEVEWLEFRYYDGSSWVDSWDSRITGNLPVAVEICFELAEPETMETEEPAPGGDDTLAVEDDPLLADDGELLSVEEMSALPDDALSAAPGTEETPYHRCVVFLGRTK